MKTDMHILIQIGVGASATLGAVMRLLTNVPIFAQGQTKRFLD